MRIVVGLILAALAFAAGCASPATPKNPSFAVSYEDAERELVEMAATPRRPRLERPVVLLAGIGSWGGEVARMRRTFAARVDGSIITVRYPFALSFDGCRRAVIEAVDRELGAGGADRMVEVDVVGESMGGLVALYAALDDPALGRRLNVRRLYTIGSPLTGARRADAVAWLSPAPLHRDLRQGSALYARLRRSPPAFPVVNYSRLGDDIVGARYASLPGENVYWLANRPWEDAHFGMTGDARILADVLRRLRGEKPLTTAAAGPLPDGVD